MTPQQVRYVRRETMIGVGISAALSAVFAFIVFGGRNLIPVEKVILDAFPQSFMIGLMTTLVPTALTRRRLKSGIITPLQSGGLGLPRNLFVRGLLVAVAAAVIGGALHWLLLPLVAAPAWAFPTVLAHKIIYGALLALSLGPFLVRRALADAHSGRS